MSLSNMINSFKFCDLNFYLFEHILKYIKFDDLVRFERVNNFWKETIRNLLNRRKTGDDHSCPGLAICDKGGHRFKATEWTNNYTYNSRELQLAIEKKCPNLIHLEVDFYRLGKSEFVSYQNNNLEWV